MHAEQRLRMVQWWLSIGHADWTCGRHLQRVGVGMDPGPVHERVHAQLRWAHVRLERLRGHLRNVSEREHVFDQRNVFEFDRGPLSELHEFVSRTSGLLLRLGMHLRERVHARLQRPMNVGVHGDEAAQ